MNAQPSSNDIAAATPYRGKTLRARAVRMDLNNPASLRNLPSSGQRFVHHPGLNVRVVDEDGKPVPFGELIIVQDTQGR